MKKLHGYKLVYFFLFLVVSIIGSETKMDNPYMENDFFKINTDENTVVLIEKKVQYKVIAKGSREKVKKTHTPLISIKGMFPDNTVFLPDYKYVTSITDLPKGLSIAILGMKEKEKRRIIMHPDYSNKIFNPLSSKSYLIYEVEILKNDKSKIYYIDNNIGKETNNIR